MAIRADYNSFEVISVNRCFIFPYLRKLLPVILKVLGCSFVGLVCSGCLESSEQSISITIPIVTSTENEKGPVSNIEVDEVLNAEKSQILSVKPKPEEEVSTENYDLLCNNPDSSHIEGETLAVQNYYLSSLREFARVNRRLKFGANVYPSGVDYNNDGVKDFYLTTANYSYSSFREDYTDFYIVPGALREAEIAVPDLSRKALKNVLFVSLNRNTLMKRNPPNIEAEGEYIMTAKVTPIKFENEIYLKVEAQLVTAQNPEYRSAYHNPPDRTTYAKINHRMEIQPIC